MKTLIISLIILFGTLLLNSQKNYIIRFQIKGMQNNAALLYSVYGDNTTIIDTAYVTEDKKIAFLLNDSNHIGMYRCLFGNNRYLDVIFNKENIDIITTYSQPGDSAQVIASVENRLLYNYFKLNRIYEMKSEYLIPVIRFYPEHDDFYKLADKEYNNLQKGRDEYIDEIVKKYPNLIVAKYLKTKKSPIIDTKMPDNEKVNYLKTHFFDNVDFNDTILLYTDAYSTKVISFLQLHKDEDADRHQEELNYIKGVDALMTHISNKDKAYNYILEYLVKGFEKFKFEEVLEYIASNYTAAKTCENEERKSKLQQSLDFYKKTAIGQTASNITLKNKDGKEITMSDIEKDYTLIIFWQTTCPHCEELFPKIKKYYDKAENRNFEIYAVSIDTNTEKWKKIITEGNLNWINVNEPNGWDNKILDNYNIYATPTMLLIDKNRTIIAKPITIPELKQAIKNIQ